MGVWGHNNVQWSRRAHDEGTHCLGPFDDEDQGGGPARAQVLRVDRGLDPVVAEHLPADVDLQGRVRRVRPDHRPQEVFLNASLTALQHRRIAGAFLAEYPAIEAASRRICTRRRVASSASSGDPRFMPALEYVARPLLLPTS